MHDDLEALRELTPAAALRKRYVLAQRLEAPGSTSGVVAERARLGLSTRPTDGGYQGSGAAEARHELAWLTGLCRDLNDAEEHACAIRYGSAGELVPYEATRRIGDVREGDGEEIISLHPRDLDNKPMGAGWVRVKGVRQRMPSYEEIAAPMASAGWLNADGQPMTHGAVKKLLETAVSKISTSIKARLMMAMLEENAAG